MASKGSAVKIVLGVLGVALIAAAVVRLRANAGEEAHAAASKPDRPTAVLVVTAERKDVPIELEGIGSAAALMNVTVRPQVDGRITKVFFTEGKPVKTGEVLAQIDPRPYQIALQQAQANLARDRATLESNQGNYDRLLQLQKGKFVAAQDVQNQRALVGQGEASLLGDQAAIDTA
ncbi:MAG: biotin/lipoyl-binding protein, partial [Polyangiales bacterium]